ncbi:MAG: ABC transporter permease [Peptococcaceae bacterium]|nr:ABC transporter permease [Peptococcaceae bacterium]
MVKRFFERIYLLIIFAFLYAPIIVLMAFSFNESKSRSMWTGFSLKWYEKVFQNSEIMSALYYTILIAILSAVIATIIGTISAIGIQSLGKWSKKAVLDINYLPVLNPDIVTGVSLMILFIFVNMRLGFLTLLLSHIVFNIPYVIISVLPKLRQLDKNVYEAALDLGATPAYAIRRVVLPQIMPGVITGLLLAFTLSLDDFVISFFTTGSGVTNLSITIYSMTRRGVSPEINAISTLMFAVVLVLLVVINGRMSQDKNVSHQDIK